VLDSSIDYLFSMPDKFGHLRPLAKTMSDSNVVTASEGIRENSFSLVFKLDT
jgi:hypothetical protein